MAKKWSGFLPQNDAVRQSWDVLVETQNNATIVLDLELPEPEAEDSDEPSAEETPESHHKPD